MLDVREFGGARDKSLADSSVRAGQGDSRRQEVKRVRLCYRRVCNITSFSIDQSDFDKC